MATQVGDYQVRVVVKDNTGAKYRQTQLNVQNAIKAMADAILQRAQMLAPMSDIEGHAGTLRATGLIKKSEDGLTASIEFGNGIAYARYQEFGDPGWNYTTEGTGPAYLQTAGESVTKEGLKKYL